MECTFTCLSPIDGQSVNTGEQGECLCLVPVIKERATKGNPAVLCQGTSKIKFGTCINRDGASLNEN